jgi:hypothetical protein
MEYSIVIIVIVVIFILIILYLTRPNTSNYRANNNGILGLEDNTYNSLHNKDKYYNDFITEYNKHPSKYVKIAVEDALYDCFDNKSSIPRINLTEYVEMYNKVYNTCMIDKRNNYVRPMNIIDRHDYEHNRLYNSFHQNIPIHHKQGIYGHHK